MSWRHLEPATLADAAVSSLVIASDPFAQSAAPGYWVWSRDAHRAVADALAVLPDARARTLAAAVSKDPADAEACRELTRALVPQLGEGDPPLAALVWQAETTSRLRMRHGEPRPAGLGAPRARDILRTAGGAARPAGQVEAAFVIPFRERGGEGHRTRNLAAVLHALADQSVPRDSYRVVVVESDSEPRWESVYGPHCDAYLFAENHGPFNYSWAVNAGVVHGARPAELLCVLEADILVDRRFVERALARFRVPGAMAHWPFEDILYLDEGSAHQAVTERCLEGRAAPSYEELRGVHLRRMPGACIWLRDSLFARVGGYDERFTAGWGGADNDFTWRTDLYGCLDRHSDPTVHLYHPRAGDWYEDSLGAYDSFPWCTWPPDSEIGDLDKFRARTSR
ncbi:galactosyltransferase-related protein [Streptomyces sp. NPDC048172]|uniref:galactosyltransferase-related protein n=1 Tax=Streptomyces sp. NPDC048172 TaxID=3365505 RepID=UPI003712F45F